MTAWVEDKPDPDKYLEGAVELQRGHFGHSSVSEETDRFVVTCSPCGSGGQLRRTKKVERVEQAQDWTWGKEEVPYYCTHCALMWEILPTEKRGYPIRINLPPEKDDDPCVHLYYKNPKDIPEEYFTRLQHQRTDRKSVVSGKRV